jgi:hypothetical protein
MEATGPNYMLTVARLGPYNTARWNSIGREV